MYPPHPFDTGPSGVPTLDTHHQSCFPSAHASVRTVPPSHRHVSSQLLSSGTSPPTSLSPSRIPEVLWPGPVSTCLTPSLSQLLFRGRALASRSSPACPGCWSPCPCPHDAHLAKPQPRLTPTLPLCTCTRAAERGLEKHRSHIYRPSFEFMIATIEQALHSIQLNFPLHSFPHAHALSLTPAPHLHLCHWYPTLLLLRMSCLGFPPPCPPDPTTGQHTKPPSPPRQEVLTPAPCGTPTRRGP